MSLSLMLVNRYRLDAELGHGGMGVVYRAYDSLLDRAVAVKLLNDSGLGTEGRARLLREARAAAQLNHPNIVSVYDAGEAGGQPYIVMELVEGESLYNAWPLPLEAILTVGEQICDALEHAHVHGIVHRDLKLENVLVAAAGTVKLTDFGLARSLATRITTEGTLTGTVFYLAPELALGQPFDGRADLYALGVLLYELTTGKLPFNADDPLAVISQHVYAPVVPPRAHNADLPAALDALIVQLLSKRPEDRPASAAEVRAALAHCQSAAPAPVVTRELSLLDRIVRGRLVGREQELAEAAALWRRAVLGDPHVLLISGEPGIGKTRLARELVALAEVAGGRVLVGECYAEGGAPYASIAQIIQAALSPAFLSSPRPSSQRGEGRGEGEISPLVLADLLTLAPSLRARFPGVSPNPALDPQAEQQRLFESVVTLFATLTEHAPVLLLVDDAHWADGGTLFLLRHLARRGRAARLRLLIVLTYREVEIDEACCLPEVLHDLNRERLATRLKLGRLSREQTGALLEVMFEEEITSDFLESLYRETEGNPFFLEEVCKALIEEGKLYYADGHWRRPNMNEIEIPQSVRVAIQARLSKLPASSQDVLRLAAILGREFDFETLRQAGDPSSGSGQALDEESLIEALENATRAQLISENRQGRRLTFAFAHALIPSTLRESLSGLRRQRLHRRAADAIAELRPDDFETLAYHFEHAGDLGQARVYYAQAGDRALTVYANPEAERHYRAALELSDSDADRARLLAGLGESLFRQSHYAEAAQTWLEAIALYRSLMDYDQVARWYARAARAAWYTDDWPRGLALCREGLQVMAGQPETPGLAALLHETGRACLFNKLPDEALLLCQQALPLAERLGLAEVQAETLATMGILSNLPIEAKKQALERAIELAESAKLLATAARGHLNLGGLLSDQGQPRVALAHYQRARELAHQMGIATWEFDYLGVFANVSLNLGDYATVETELITLRKLRETLPATSRLAFFPEMLEAMLQGFRGQLAEGAARIRALYIEVSQHPDSKFLHELDGILAQFYIFQGEFVQAEQCAHGGLERALHLGLEGNEAYFYAMLCLALSGQGRCVEAHQALEAVRQKQKSPSGLFDQAALHWAESALAVAEKRWDEALAAFEAGTQVISALGLRWHQARAFREWAEAYLGRDRPGDRERAIDLLRQSQALFEELKVPHFARLVGERLESLVVLSPA